MFTAVVLVGTEKVTIDHQSIRIQDEQGSLTLTVIDLGVAHALAAAFTEVRDAMAAQVELDLREAIAA